MVKEGRKAGARLELKPAGLSQSSPCSCCCMGYVGGEWSLDEGLGLQGMMRKLASRPRRAGSEQSHIPLRLPEGGREFPRPGVPE